MSLPTRKRYNQVLDQPPQLKSLPLKIRVILLPGHPSFLSTAPITAGILVKSPAQNQVFWCEIKGAKAQ